MRLARFFIFASLFAANLAARADTIYSYTIVGSGNQSTNGAFTVTGTTTIDVTTGLYESISFTTQTGADTFVSYSGIDSQQNSKVYVGGGATQSTEALFSFSGDLMNISSGDNTYNLATPDGNDYVGHLLAGTPVVLTATPEPSSIILLGSGLLGIAFALRRSLA